MRRQVKTEIVRCAGGVLVCTAVAPPSMLSINQRTEVEDATTVAAQRRDTKYKSFIVNQRSRMWGESLSANEEGPVLLECVAHFSGKLVLPSGR